MSETLRETGPGLLVPLAWLFVTGAEVGVVSEQSIFIAHLVMAAFITFFLATGWTELSSGALAGWRVVMVVGLGATLAGIAGFVFSSGAGGLLLISLVGWMLLPAVGLAYTARLLDSAAGIYLGSAVLSGIGAVVYLLSLAGLGFGIAGIALVGIGQTVGIVDAVVRF